MSDDKSHAEEFDEPGSIDHSTTKSLFSLNTETLSEISSNLSACRRRFSSKGWKIYDFLNLGRRQMLFPRGTKSAESRRNDEVEEMLHMWEKERKKEVKILLAGSLSNPADQMHPAYIRLQGCGGSGKATFLRHLRILYGQPYAEDERVQWRSTIFKNLTSGFHTVLQYMREQHIEFENSDNKASRSSSNVTSRY